MKFFELTLQGFDGGTDATDHLIKWVIAPNRSVLYDWLRKTGLARLVQSVDTNNNYNALTFADGIDVVIEIDHDDKIIARTKIPSIPDAVELQWRKQVNDNKELSEV